MNILLLSREEVEGYGSEFVVTGRRSRHIRSIIGANIGDTLKAGIIGGSRGTVRLLAIEGEKLTLQLEFHPDEAAIPPLEDLIIALPRPKVFSRVIESVAAIGIAKIHIINAWKVDKNYFNSKHLAPKTIEKHVLLGMEQGAQTWQPKVHIHRYFTEFINSFRFSNSKQLGIVAHLNTEKAIEDVFTNNRPLTLAIGPEGGWIPKEIQSFIDLGFHPAHSGPSIMRVESAGVALLAQVQLLRRVSNSSH